VTGQNTSTGGPLIHQHRWSAWTLCPCHVTTLVDGEGHPARLHHRRTCLDCLTVELTTDPGRAGFLGAQEPPLEFTVTEQHLALVARLNIWWEVNSPSGSLGAVGVNQDRPYGNESILADLAAIVPSDSPDIDPADRLPELLRLHRETEWALQIVLSVGRFRPGRYERDDVDQPWQLADPEVSNYDFMELILFAHKVEDEGWDYALEHYPPRFENRELRWLADDPEEFNRFYQDLEPTLEEWWTQRDIDTSGLYHAHLKEREQRADEHRRRSGDAGPAAEPDELPGHGAVG
jgi:hypothetical protein